MTNMQLIDELCRITERLVDLVREMANRLSQLDSLNEEEQRAIIDIEKTCADLAGNVVKK